MNPLPLELCLGRLTVETVYEYYDRPCLFSCRNAAGQLFLATWADGSADEEVWFYAGMSRARADALLDGRLDFYTVFRTPETEVLWRVAEFPDGTRLATPIPAINVPDDVLPDRDEVHSHIDGELHIAPPCVTEYARSIRRDCLFIRLSPNGAHRFSMPAKPLGYLLSQLQELVEATAEGQSGRSVDRAPVPDEIQAQTEMRVDSSFRASFGLRLYSAQGDAFENSVLRNSLDSVFELFAAGDDFTAIGQYFDALANQRAVTRYLRWLRGLENAGTEVEVSWASADASATGVARFTPASARRTSAVVQAVEEEEPITQTATGRFIIINVAKPGKERFRFRSTTDGVEFAGAVGPAAVAVFRSASPDENYEVTVRVVASTNPMTGEEKVRHTLTSISVVPRGTTTEG